MRTIVMSLCFGGLALWTVAVTPDVSQAANASGGNVCPVQVTSPGGGSIALRGTIAVDLFDPTQLAGCPNNCPATAIGDVIVRLSRGGSQAFFRSRQTLPLGSNAPDDYLATLCQIIQDSTLKSTILGAFAPGKTSLVITRSSVQDYDGPPNVNDSPAQMFVPNVSDVYRHIVSMADVTIYAQ